LPALVDAGSRWRELDVDDVLEIRVLAVRDDGERPHIIGGANDPFTEKESERKVAVVAGRAHHEGQRLAGNTDFQWLLSGELVFNPGTDLAAVAEDSRPMGAAILH
jgi:hypothetical protein